METLLGPFKDTTSDQCKDQGLSSEGAKTKETIKMDEPIAQRTKCRFKIQRPSEPGKETIFLGKTDTEMRELPIQLVAQNRNSKTRSRR